MLASYTKASELGFTNVRENVTVLVRVHIICNESVFIRPAILNKCRSSPGAAFFLVQPIVPHTILPNPANIESRVSMTLGNVFEQTLPAIRLGRVQVDIVQQ